MGGGGGGFRCITVFSLAEAEAVTISSRGFSVCLAGNTGWEFSMTSSRNILTRHNKGIHLANLSI